MAATAHLAENVSTAPSRIVVPRIAGREAAIVHAKSCVKATGVPDCFERTAFVSV